MIKIVFYCLKMSDARQIHRALQVVNRDGISEDSETLLCVKITCILTLHSDP